MDVLDNPSSSNMVMNFSSTTLLRIVSFDLTIAYRFVGSGSESGSYIRYVGRRRSQAVVHRPQASSPSRSRSRSAGAVMRYAAPHRAPSPRCGRRRVAKFQLSTQIFVHSATSRTARHRGGVRVHLHRGAPRTPGRRAALAGVPLTADSEALGIVTLFLGRQVIYAATLSLSSPLKTLSRLCGGVNLHVHIFACNRKY
jgi:hypothetical protein